MLEIHLALPIWLVILMLASFRVTWFMTREAGPFDFMGRIRGWLARKASDENQTGLAWSVAELFHCPLCLGFWVCGILFLIYAKFPANIFWNYLFIILAIAGVQAIVSLYFVEE